MGLRGGGGNFGVVTSFQYRLHPVGPQVLAGGVVHAFADAPELFRFLGDFVAEAPDELSVTASTFRASPAMSVPAEMHGELVTVLAVCFAGDLTAGEEALRPLRSFGRPVLDGIAPIPYTALQSGSDAAYPNGQHNYWKSHYIDELTEDVIATIIETCGTDELAAVLVLPSGTSAARSPAGIPRGLPSAIATRCLTSRS